jgi:hypothetical protein
MGDKLEQGFKKMNIEKKESAAPVRLPTRVTLNAE